MTGRCNANEPETKLATILNQDETSSRKCLARPRTRVKKNEGRRGGAKEEDGLYRRGPLQNLLPLSLKDSQSTPTHIPGDWRKEAVSCEQASRGKERSGIQAE